MGEKAMEHTLHALECLGRASGIGIGILAGAELTSVFGVNGSNPLRTSTRLCQMLVKRSQSQAEPVIYQDRHGILFGCIKGAEAYYLLGPLPCRTLSRAEVGNYCKLYDIENGNEKLIHSFTIAQIIAVIALAAEIITGMKYSDEELLGRNGLHATSDEALLHDRVQHYILDEERELHHHTYAEELAILACVKEGKVDEVQQKSLALDRILGKLSQDELTHWKNAAVAAITLCSRAAMEVGVSPATAYHFSDFYIQRLDKCRDIPSVIALRNKAVCELTDQVNQKRKIKVEGYVDQCMDYVSKHYREKIYLEELADGLGLSANYLSKLFSKVTGVHLQDYIVQHRVERAKGFLIHSDMSIAEVGVYVGFPSQSYFGRVFKKYTGMTPLKYREEHGLREFGS